MFKWLAKLFATKPPPPPPIQDNRLATAAEEASHYLRVVRQDFNKFTPAKFHRWEQIGVFFAAFHETLNKLETFDKLVRHSRDAYTDRYANEHLHEDGVRELNFLHRLYATPFEQVVIKLALDFDLFGSRYGHKLHSYQLTINHDGETIYHSHGSIDSDTAAEEGGPPSVHTNLSLVDISALILRYLDQVLTACETDLAAMIEKARALDAATQAKYKSVLTNTVS